MPDERAIVLANRQLELGIVQLEALARQNHFNTLCIAEFAEVSLLCENVAIAERGFALLASASRSLRHSDYAPEVKTDRAAIDSKHPTYDLNATLSGFRAAAMNDDAVADCFDGNVAAIRAKAKSKQRLEELGNICAVVGSLDAASKIACDTWLEPFRQRSIRQVMSIECVRRERFDDCKHLLEKFDRTDIDAWERSHLACGFYGRVPWYDYPFVDW